MKNVAVLGSGSWGTALAVMLQNNGHSVVLWARREELAQEMTEKRMNQRYLPDVILPEGMRFTSDHAEAVREAEIIISAVPSKALRKTMMDFQPFFRKGQVLVNVAKGFELETNKRLSVVMEECAPMCEVCTLSGPSHAEEVSRGIPTTCLIASENEEVAKMVQTEFINPTFRLYTNTDVIGVEVGAALKNIMALAAGTSDGLGFGDNTKAALMTRGIAEMARLGTEMGGKMETFAGLSGIGDLIVTCTSMHSRNRRAGILLGQGKTLEETLAEVGMVVEGANAAKAARELAKQYDVEMPITNVVCEVLFEGKNARDAVLELMNRDSKAE